jgi:hypothetical protein
MFYENRGNIEDDIYINLDAMLLIKKSVDKKW